MIDPWRCLPMAALATLSLAFLARADDPPTAAQAEFFEKKVRPILAEHCLGCHGPQKQQGGLRLDSRAALLKGSDSGPIVEPGKPDDSLILEAVRQTGSLKMPPKSKLPDASVAVLQEWIQAGLPWPADRPAASSSEAARGHWAFQAVRDPPLPSVQNDAWVRQPLDQFVLAKLEAEGLPPAPPADRRTLIRRASFALVGLPPTPEEVAAFEADADPDAFPKLIERLLASPHYGERWARHWMDVSRYADNKGYVFFEDGRFPWAYTYRDYVVRAFNDDLPYDRFLLEQLAADQLDLGADRRPLTALGFLTLGGHFMSNTHDILDDRIDVVTRGLMGLTVTCARCHDHKFDPVPQADYYSLYGVFRSSTEPMLPPEFQPAPDTEERRKFDAEMQARLLKLDEFVRKKHRELVESAQSRVAEYLVQAQANKDQPSTENFMLLNNPGDLHPTVLTRWWVLLDKTRRRPDPVWAAWHALATLPAAEFATRAPEACQQLKSANLNPLVVAAVTEPPPQSLSEVAQRYAALLKETNEQWLNLLQTANSQGPPPPKSLPDPHREQLLAAYHAEDAPSNVPLTSGWGFLTLLPDRPAQGEYQKLLKEVEQWSMTGPGAPPRAMVLFDEAAPYPPKIFQRGNPNRPGESVPRQFLSLANPDRRPFTQGSGRLELAREIASPGNPLTARVLVNRVWMHHFGAGLVRTPGDFGLRCDPPSHPELLDSLAWRFVQSGWSIKSLHREILLSSVWQQSGVNPSPDAPRKDPENRWLWHMPPRRLDFEASRDSLHSVAGTLDRQVGGPSVDFFASSRRSVYGSIDRLNVQSLLRTFDVPSPDATSPQRDQTTIAGQALFLMNGPLAQDSAARLLARPDLAALTDFEARMERVYRLLFGRPPTADDRTLAETFFGADTASRSRPDLWQQFVHGLLMTNEFAFVD